MGGYDEYEFPVPETFFDDFSTRSPFVSKTWMALKGMKGHVLNIAPLESEIAANPKLRPPFLTEMSPKQRKAWHQAYDPRNKRYRELEKQDKLKGDERNLYVYQRFIKDYVRCIDGLDAQIGRILRFWMRRIWRKTPFWCTVRTRVFSPENTAGLKNDGCMRKVSSLPFWCWPGVIEPGSVIEDLVQNIDLAPTFLQAAGLDVPKALHGLALQPLFSESGPKEWREEVLYQYFDGGTLQKPGPYNMPRHEGIRNRRYKLISFYEYDTWEFYDLHKDPNELRNLIGDPSMRAKNRRDEKKTENLEGSLLPVGTSSIHSLAKR